MRPAAEPFLVDDNRHAQVIDLIGVGLWIAGQEPADKGAEVFVELALCLRSDRIKDDRRFARPRDAGKDSYLLFGNFERDIFEVVFARIFYLDIFLHTIILHVFSGGRQCVLYSGGILQGCN